MVKEDQKIKFEELIEKGWRDSGFTFADLIIMLKGHESLLYDKEKEKIFHKSPK
jgi:hypothetical protein